MRSFRSRRACPYTFIFGAGGAGGAGSTGSHPTAGSDGVDSVFKETISGTVIATAKGGKGGFIPYADTTRDGDGTNFLLAPGGQAIPGGFRKSTDNTTGATMCFSPGDGGDGVGYVAAGWGTRDGMTSSNRLAGGTGGSRGASSGANIGGGPGGGGGGGPFDVGAPGGNGGNGGVSAGTNGGAGSTTGGPSAIGGSGGGGGGAGGGGGSTGGNGGAGGQGQAGMGFISVVSVA